jgi:DNA polymerase I-like protein with 3'-5' exonuclease and polymerase domains
MQAAIASMKKQLEDAEKAKHSENLLASVKSAMKAKGATDDAVMLYTFKGESIDTTKSVDELTESYLKTYDANYKTLRGEGASPRNGDGNPNPKEDDFLKNFFAQKAAEGKFPEVK